ncbi:uncharacterized protein LOC130412901 [Triplophysa dalaica]|uniref:uncharacterized protein LOC130412901 n=1 Tax=Triplophysa dalaica TaxID=1582913 RepID=UPI0024DFD7C3|nr:uncharacterized protein LOC130412901 [Triplophysa dalaica]
MTDSQHLTDSAQTRVKELCPTDGIRKKGILIEDGNPARYRLETTIDHIDESESHRKIIFGERDTKKPHKTFLIVGETGTGKTTLINTMINYTCGVQREDKIWIEITDDQSDRTSAHSQTSIITVYGVYIPESSVDLTIIDTPGYGDTRGTGHDKEIGRSLQHVGTSDDVAYGTSAVCFVIKADQNRLTDRQQYIFDAVQCLFGKDIEENIVLLFTHSTGARPKNALTAVKEAKIKCAVDEKKQPIYFLFNNCQSEAFDEEDQTMQDHLWDLSYKGMTGLFKFLDTVRPKTLQMTKDVLQKRKQLEANISNLQSRVQEIEIKHTELKQTEEALEKQNQYFQDNKNFEFTVEVPYKEMVDIDPAVAGKAMCCTVCEENCHYPDCWWVKSLSWCTVMKGGYCTVCTKKCHYSKHKKEAKIYVTKTKPETKSSEDLKIQYTQKMGENTSLMDHLKTEIHSLDKKKEKLVTEAYSCVETLEMIALKSDSLFILQHIDFLIEKLNEMEDTNKAAFLMDIKKRAGEERKKKESTYQ